MKILIIGGTRFLGAAIARELTARGHSVTVMHRGETQGDLPAAIAHVQCDRRDQPGVESALAQGRFDAVVDTILWPEDLPWHLPLLQRHTGQLVHCGSTGVYAPMAYLPVREEDATPCPPELGSFDTKLAQDNIVTRFREQTGFRVCSLRISNVFGRGDVPLDLWGARNPAYYQRVANGEEIWIPNDGRTLLQPVHVADLARGFADVIEAPSVPEVIYNMSSERALTLDEYAAIGMELLGSQSPVRHVPMHEILALNKTNEAGLRFLCEHMCIDSSRAARDFGYAPRIGVREGLRDSLRWMVETRLIEAEVASA